jgi:putative transposase
VLLRLAYLGVTNALALLRLLPMTDQAKHAQILTLRHRIAVLEQPTSRPEDPLHPRRPGVSSPRCCTGRPATRCGPSGCSCDPRPYYAGTATWSPGITPVSLDPNRSAARQRHARSAHCCCGWLARTTRGGYRTIHSELIALGIKVAASTVWQILTDAGIDPPPQRTCDTWAAFLRSQTQAITAADFFETSTLTGARLYVLTVIEHTTRRVRILAATTHPTTGWVTRAARNLTMDLDDTGSRVKYLIRDRDGKYPALFDAILADIAITTVPSGIQPPRMNSVIERWIQSWRHELLDRTLIWNQAHLQRALREYERHDNLHRPHRGISNARPLCPLPEPIIDPAAITRLRIRRHDRPGGLLHEYHHAA